MVQVIQELVGEVETWPVLPVYEYTLVLDGQQFQKLQESGLFEMQIDVAIPDV